jgi:hypothetical protein
MQERKTLTKAMAQQYRRGSKKDKGKVLTQFVEATGYNRVYAARLLRNHGRRIVVNPGIVVEASARARRKAPGRDKYYDGAVVKVLEKLWRIGDHICGKRLVVFIRESLPCLMRKGELHISAELEAKLMRISAASIDRLLAPERKKHELKGRGGTKPGTLLKHQVPVRTFADWDNAHPGFLELDLVGHDGGSTAGEYCQTLDATDVATGWSEQLAVPTKAQVWVFEAIGEMRNRLPFPLLGLDSDNGSEFINHHLVDYCEQHQVSFTRSRAGRKNDQCYVEQKNWTIVRRFAGYGRYENHDACACLNDLYVVVREYVNFFMPSQKLIEKRRDGSRVTRRYDAPQTPYQRVLASPAIDAATKRRLKRHYATLNPAELKRRIEALQKKLVKLTARALSGNSGNRTRYKPGENHPWRRSMTKSKTG